MKKFYSFNSFVLTLSLVFIGFYTSAQTTVTYPQQTGNYYSNWTTGTAGAYNQGANQVGMFANGGGTKQVVSWRKFRTDASGSATSDRALQVGDQFVVTISATRAFGKIGFALLANPGTGNWANRESNYAISFNMDGPGYTGGYTWYARYAGGTTSTGSNNVNGQQTTYKNFTFTLTLTAPDRMNATWTDGTTTSTLNDILLNTSSPITDYSIFLEDDWDGGANRNIFWGLGAVGNQHTVTNQGTLNHGQSNSSYTVGGVMNNGLDANSVSSNTLNNALIKNGTGNLTLNAANTYTGQTLINNGELWIGSTGSISLSSAISVGSGVSNVAKLWLSNASGGTTFSNDFTINNGNPNTREIGGLNTSGTHTFSGFITNNPSISGLTINALNAGGTTTISGVISGGGAVFSAGLGTVIFSGASQNNYTSTFTAGAATTVFNKSANIRAIGTGNVTINTGATLRTNANNQLGTGTVSLITINGTGIFNLNNTNQKVALASASSSASVTLGSGTLNLDNTGTDTYAGVISGSGGLTKTNTGTQILSNTGNSYTGATTITGGTLRLGAAGVIADASNVTMSGGTLSTGAAAGFSETMGTLSMTASSTIALGTGSHTITFANSSANSWTFGTILTITGWTGTNDGNSSGTAGRIFVGNTASGLTGVQLSRIRFNISSVLYGAMQLSTGEVVPTGGTVLYWNGTGTWSTSNTWSLTEGGPYNQTWVSGSHAIFNAASTITGFTTNVAAITANQNVTVTAGGTIAFGPAGTTIAPIYVESSRTFDFNGQTLTSSATAGVIKNGTGILNMGGGGTFAGGFTLNAGIAAAGGVNGLGNGPLVINGGTLTSNSATNINPAVTSITVNNDFQLGDVVNFAAATGNLTFTANVALGATTRIITLGNTSTQTFSGIISGTSTAGLTLAATALGTLAISGANTYPGATTINGGTLSCTGANTLPSTTNVTLANTSSASLTLGTFSQTINSLAGGGTTGGNVSVTSAGVLTINGTTSTTYSGILSGTGALVKSGTGILTLANAANAHTGTTTINTTSEIRLNPATNATFASQIKLNGGKLSTTGIAASRTWTSSSTLSLDANSSIDLGAAVHTITFDNSSGVTWAGSTLTINGWTGTVGSSGTGGKIFFGNTTGTLTAGQLSKITFTGYAGTPILLGSGELVPPVSSVTYTWNGSAGDNNWATTTNWTPNGNPGASDNVIIPVATGLLNITGAQTVIDFTLSGTGTFQVSSTGSLTITGNLTNSSSATPTFNCGSTFTVSGAGQSIPAWNYGNLVLSGATVTLASSGTIGICGNYTPSAGVTTLTGSIVNFNGTSGQSILTNPASFRNLTVSNTAANVTASVAITVSNLLTINSSARLDMGTNVLTITGATSAIAGFLRCAVASTTPITGASTATLTFNSGGTYECNAPMSGAALSGLGIPLATWNNGSICTIIGLTNPIPGGWFGAGIGGVSFSNFIWNCTGQTTAPIMGGGTTLTTRGTFTMLSTGSSDLSLASGSNGTINCGAFNQSGGTINMSAGTGIGTIILTFNAGSSGAFTQSAGTITESSSGSGLISFSSAVSQTITISNPANITNVINFRLNNTAGAVLAAGTILPINNGATLSRTAGAFSGAGSISYNTTGSNLVYDGGSNITSTNYEFPSINGPVNLQIWNSGGVNLHSSRSLPASGVLTLTSGIFALGANSLTILNPALAAITGTFNASNMVVADGAGQLIRAVNTSTFGARTWPIGDSSGDYSPVVLNFSANNTVREIGFRVADANHPQLNTPDFQTHFISRNWPATNNAAGTYTYTGNFTYVTADINGTQANIKLNKYNGSAWAQANSTAAANVLTLAASETEATFPIDASVDYTGRVKVPSVYAWNPTTGTQDFTVAGNWTPARTAPAFDDVLTFPNGGSSTANNVPSQTIGQIILSGGTTIALIPSASNNTLTLTGGTGTDLDIPAGSVLFVGQTTGNSLTLTYSATGHVASIAGALTLAVNTTNFNTYITTNATTTVSGVLNNGGVVTSTAPVLIFSATGTYDHTRNAGTIPTSTWTTGTPGATCLLSGTGVTIPSGLSQAFANFTINRPTVTSTLSATGNLTSIAQNLTVALASSGVLRLQNAAASYTLNIGGNLDLQSGIIEWCDGGSSLNTSNIIIAGNLTQAASSIMQNGSGGQNVSMTVGGNFIQNGGTFTLNGTTNTITLRGNFIQNGVVQRTGGTASISFINLSGTLQTWTQTSGTNTGAISWSVGNGTLSNTLQLTTDVSLGTSAQTFTLNNNATLDFQDKILSGTNTTFTSGATNTTIRIGSQYGITSAAVGITSGNIQTLTRTVSNLTSFVYSGTVNQVTGNLLPATLGAGKSLTISNTGTFGNNTVTLTTNNTETRQLNLVSGLFAAGAGQQLNITATTGIITGTGGNCVVGTSGGTINFNGAGTINGSSAFTFNNVTINTGALAIPTGATIPTIGGTLQINGGNLTNPLYYGAASTLNYNVAYGRFVEWNASGVGTIGTTLGYPNNVTVNTGVLDINNASNIARACAGNLTINNGAILSMGSMTGALIVAGDVTFGGGTSGVLTLSSSAGGDIYVGGNWTRNAGSIFNDNTRAVFFDGLANQNIGGSLSTTFSFLFLNNSAGATLTAAQTISTALTLTNGKLTLGNFDLNCNGTISGASTARYIITNGTGQLKQTVVSSTVFPVGNSSYNPLSLTAGTTDTYGVRVLDGTITGSTTPNDVTKTINRLWAVTEGTTGGTITPAATFNSGEENNAGVFSAATQPYIGISYGTTYSHVVATSSGSTVYTASSTITPTASSYFIGVGKDDAFRAIPLITSYTPTSAYSGDVITITGTNLNALTSVTIGGVAAILTTPAATSTTANYIVGNGASGNLVVTNAAGNATASAAFTYLGYISDNNTDWNTGSTWRGGNVPPVNATTTINSNITINGTVVNNPNTILVNATKSIAFGGGSIGINSSVTNNGTINMTAGGTLTMANASTFANGSATFTGGTGTVVFAGAATVITTGGIPFNNVTINAAINLGASTSIAGTLRVNQGGSIVTNALTYGAGSTLSYNGTSSQTPNALEFPASSGPTNFTANNSVNVSLPFSRTVSGNVRILSGDLRNSSGTGVTLTMSGAAATLEVTGALQGTDIGAGNDINLIISGTTTVSGSNVTTCKVLNTTVNTGATLALARSNVEVRYGAFNINGTGTLRIDANGNVASIDGNSRVPIYASTANLVYNSGGTYGRFVEWSTLSGPAGYPGNVTIQNGTTLNIGSPATDLGIVSNLTLGVTGSTGSLNMQATPQGITVGGNVTVGSDVNTSTLTLSTNASSPALRVGGNWNRNSFGSFVGTGANGRGVFFNGTGAQTLTANGGETFQFLIIQKTVGTNLTLNNAVTVASDLNLTSGNIILGTNNLTLNAAATISNASASSFVITNGTGYLQKVFTANGTYTWPVGDNTGTVEYSPATLNVTSSGGTLGMRVVNAPHPNNGSSVHYINRYWNTSMSAATYSWDGSFNYTNADVVGTQTNMLLNIYDPNAPNIGWTEYPSSSAAANVLTVTTGPSTGSLNNTDIKGRKDVPLYYRSIASGDWSDVTKWESSTDPAFISPAPTTPVVAAPNNINSAGIQIRNTHTIIVTSTVAADDLDVQIGGVLTVGAGGNFALVNGFAATDFTVNGTFNVNNTTTLASGSSTVLNSVWNTTSTSLSSLGNLVANSSAVYTHNVNGGTIPTATWNAGTTVIISGITNIAPTGLSQNFYDVEWNSPTQSAAIQLSSNPFTTIQNNLTITNTGSTSNDLRLFSGTIGGTTNIGGNLTINGGRLGLSNGGGSNAATVVVNVSGNVNINAGLLTFTGTTTQTANFNTLNITGNLTLNGGNVNFNSTGFVTSGNQTLNLGGNLDIQNGQILRSVATTSCIFRFNKVSGVQTYSAASPLTAVSTHIIDWEVGNGTTEPELILSNSIIIKNGSTFRVKNNATLNCGASSYVGDDSGGTTFTLESDATIKTANADGIVLNTGFIFGSVRSGSARNFSSNANYIYNGTFNQVTGTGLPTAHTGTLEIASSATVTLTTTNSTGFDLKLTSGAFAIGNGQTYAISSGGTVTGNGGDFATGINGGTLNFPGTGAFIGNTNPYIVTASGAVNFGTTTTIQNGGTFRINSGGAAITNAPAYAVGSTLEYATGAPYDRGIEWSTASGKGFPHHVLITSTTLNPARTGATYATQPFNTGGNLTIASGGNIYMDYSGNNMTVPLTINGNLTLVGQLSGSGSAGGDIRIRGNWINNGSATNNYFPNSRAVFFDGSSAQTIGGTNTGSNPFTFVFIDNTAVVSLLASQTINNQLTHTNGLLSLGNFDLTMAPGSIISGAGVGKYTNTNGNGRLIQEVVNGGGDKVYPIGTATSYAPVTLNQGNTTDNIGIRVKAAPVFSPTVNDFNQMVNFSYNINEAVGGGNNLITKFQWNTSDEAAGFIRSSTVYHGDWDGSLWQIRAASATAGANPYTSTAAGFIGNLSAKEFVVGNINGIRGCFATVQAGDWDNPLTWGGTLPPTNSTVCISHTLTVTTANPNNLTALTFNSGSSLTVSPLRTINIVAGGTVSNNSGSVINLSNGKVAFLGNATVGGTQSITFNDLDVNGAATINISPTINGTLSILNSGFINTNSVIYGPSSTLNYIPFTSYNVSTEWTGNSATAGLGVPANVTLANGVTLNMPNSNRGCAGTIQIVNGALVLNNTSGDLYVGGDWVRLAAGIFTPNNRAVFFNGTGAQTISSASLTESFPYLCINKPSGTLTLTTDINITSNTGNGFQLSSGGSFDLNTRTLSFSTSGGNINNASAGVANIVGGVGSLISISGGTKTITSSVGGTFSFGPNVTIALSSGLDFGSSLSTVNGTLQIANGGFVSTNPPTYSNTSTLRYFSGSVYGRGAEWSTTSGPGYPNNVTVDFNGAPTTLDLSNGGSAIRQIAGNLTINNGGTLTMNTTPMTNYLRVLGNVSIGSGASGSLILSSIDGGDLQVGGNLTRNAGATFNQFTREVTMNGATIQNVNNVTSFNYLKIDNTGSSVQLNANTDITNRLWLSSGLLNLNGNNVNMANGSKIRRSQATATISAAPAINLAEVIDIEYNGTLTTGNEFITDLDKIRDIEITAGTATLSGNKTVNRNLILSGGNLNLGTFTFTHRGRATSPAFSGSITVSGGGTRVITGSAGCRYDVTGLGANQPNDYTKTVSTSGGTLLNFDSNVLLRVGDGAIDFGAGNPTTINGTLQILLGGSVGQMLNPCYYGTNSTLRISNTVDYVVGVNDKTWAAGSINSGNAGIPFNVEILDAGTDLRLEDTRSLRGNLTVTNGSFSLNYVGVGTFSLGGNWTRTGATSAFNDPTFKKIIFDRQAAGDQTITTGSGVAFETFYDLEISPALGDVIATSGTAINVTNNLNFVTGKFILNGTNLITVGTASASGSITGVTPSKYLVTYNGGNTSTLKRFTGLNAVYNFPVGDATNYTPIDLTLYNGSTPGSFITGSVTATSHPQIGTSLNYLNRYWSMEQTGLLAGFAYGVDFSYVQTDVAGSEATIFPYKWTPGSGQGTGWIGAGGSSASFQMGTGSVNIGANTMHWEGIYSFSDITGNGGGTPLPISLINFDAKKNVNSTALSWSTLSETNNDFFTIERTLDGVNFTEIDKVKGAGNHNGILNYSSLDTNPANGKNYYRLKQTDFDGNFEYSKLVMVEFEGIKSQKYISVYPNPSNGNNVNVSISGVQNKSLIVLRLSNSKGAEVYNSNLTAASGFANVQLQTSDLANGIYYLQIIIDGEITNQKIIVTNR